MTLYHEPPPMRSPPPFQVRSDSRESRPPPSHTQGSYSRDDRSGPLVQQYLIRSVSPMSQRYGNNGSYETNSSPRPPSHASSINYPHQERYQQQRPAPQQLSSPPIATYDPAMYVQVYSQQQPDYQGPYPRHAEDDIAAPISINRDIEPRQSFYDEQEFRQQEPLRYVGDTSRQSPPPDTTPRQQNFEAYGARQSGHFEEATKYGQAGPTFDRRRDRQYDDERDPSSTEGAERGQPRYPRLYDPRPAPYDFNEHDYRVSGNDRRQYEQQSYNNATDNDFNHPPRGGSNDTPRRRYPVEPYQSDFQSFRPTGRNPEPMRPGEYSPNDYGRESVHSGFGRWERQSPSGYLRDQSRQNDDSAPIPRGSYRQVAPPSPPASVVSYRSDYTNPYDRQPQEARQVPDRSVRYSQSPQRRHRSPASSVGDESRRSSLMPSDPSASLPWRPEPRITIISFEGGSHEEYWQTRDYSGPPLDLSAREALHRSNLTGPRGHVQSQMSGLVSLVQSVLGGQVGSQQPRGFVAIGVTGGGEWGSR